MGLKSTYAIVGLSSRFNHVGVIAIKKHPTEKEEQVGEDTAEIQFISILMPHLLDEPFEHTRLYVLLGNFEDLNL